MTTNFKITGTPREPVRLDTLKPGNWVTSANQPDPSNSSIWPARITGHEDDEVRVCDRADDYENYPGSLLVHPLTRHEHADGTVEFRHVGKEVKDDTCPACNGTGVKPAPEPEPTYLERLPEAVRDFIRGHVCLLDDDGNADLSQSAEELLARTIWEHRDAIFAAGEPVERLETRATASSSMHNILVEEADNRPNAGRVWVACHRGSCGWLEPDDAVEMARRIVALASKGGA